MVVNRYRKILLSLILTNHVLIQKLLDLGRLKQLHLLHIEGRLLLKLLLQNAVGLLNATVTDVTRNTGNQQIGILATSSAKRTFIHIQLPLSFLFFLLAHQNLIDHSVGLGLFGSHPEVPVRVLFHLLKGIARMVGNNGVQLLTQLNNFARGDFNIDRLALGTAHGLVNHYP